MTHIKYMYFFTLIFTSKLYGSPFLKLFHIYYVSITYLHTLSIRVSYSLSEEGLVAIIINGQTIVVL